MKQVLFLCALVAVMLTTGCQKDNQSPISFIKVEIDMVRALDDQGQGTSDIIIPPNGENHVSLEMTAVYAGYDLLTNIKLENTTRKEKDVTVVMIKKCHDPSGNITSLGSDVEFSITLKKNKPKLLETAVDVGSDIPTGSRIEVTFLVYFDGEVTHSLGVDYIVVPVYE